MIGSLMKGIHPSWVVVCFCLGIVIGVILGLILRIQIFNSPLFVIFVIIALLLGIFCSRRFMLILVFIAGLTLAFFRIAEELYGEEYIRQFYGQTVLISGTVVGDPEADFTGTKIKLSELKFGEMEISTSGSIYISARYIKELARSDVITIRGKMSEGFGTYAGYMYKPAILSIRRAEPGNLVVRIRDFFADRIRGLIQEPEASLGLSYLLGMKVGLPDDLSESLRIVGLVHIVVASGAHLSILVEIAKKLFGQISRFSGLLFSVLFVLFFMCMVGWTPSILRAGIMTILTLIAWYVGRKFAAWRIILIVAALTLMINPNFLFNLGWLLSFSSYAGIMILGPILTKFFYGEKKPGFLSSIILTTIAATLMTLPLTLYYYGTFSLISVLANLLILPTLPYAMGLVFLTGLFKGIPGVEIVISFLATKLLDFHIFVVEFLGNMKSFLVQIEPENPLIFLVYSLILGVIMVKLKKKRINFKRERNMSGHSKWATTKRQKAVVDAKRGALFTKIGNQIAIAARSGTDPAMNPSLAMILEKARLANMPKANIERAIARVADKSAAALIEEVYEAYGPGGVGIVIEVATDNKNRTLPEVRHTLDKNGGRMADSGSVMFQFKRKGVIEISEKGEDALMVALDAGAEDASEEDESVVIYTDASDLMKVKKALDEAGMTVTSAEIQYVPTSYIPVDGENAEKLEKLLSAVDDLDDVTNVYTNAE